MTENQQRGEPNLHGTGFVIDGAGLLLRGASGAGKSLLTLQLLDHAALAGKQAYLVADDRVDLVVRDNKLMMLAPSGIAGLIELRGRGIIKRPHLKQAEVHLVVDISDSYERLVEEEALTVELAGVTLARCPLPNRDKIDALHQQLLVLEALSALKQPE